MSTHRLKDSDRGPAVGRDVDTWCRRCGAELAHTILAMVNAMPARVRCNTCSSEHNFKLSKARATAPRKTRSAAAAQTKPPSQRNRELFDRKIAELDRAQALRYSPKMRPHAGQLIDHPSFGYGVVEHLVGDKASILFAEGPRTLIVNR